jgi:beta-galactosidase
MKLFKRILKIFGYFLLFALAMGIYLWATKQYQFKVKPGKELEAFKAENFNYDFQDGQLHISSSRFSDFTLIDSVGLLNSNTPSTRKTISLNSTWQIAEGDFDKIPLTFPSTVPVPGFANMATPAFDDVGKVKRQFIGLGSLKPSQLMTIPKFEDKKREAFWYKKEFTISGDVPTFVQLKVHRAKYGSAVWLNGVKLGENGKNYQPGYFDATDVVKGKGEKNELIIRVGTSSTFSHNNSNIIGDVYEKRHKLPGIYDNVELVLFGTIQVEKVQVVPNIENETAKVIAWVNNRSGTATTTSLKFIIKKYQSDTIVGAVETSQFSIKENETKLIEVVIPITDCRLWSPEHPNLYTLTTQSNGDVLETRFGMREFYFDKNTKIPTLNHKPYYLRGTSVPFFRYLENPYQKEEVWDEEWVRAVFKRFKEMNWNSLRFHVGQAPSMWYRIADEEGIIIQDEYAVWAFFQRTGVSLETFVDEYVGWMEEQWNHASVLIWDTQNETTGEPRTGWALNIVRTLDESNRPWDNGWGEIQSETDTRELHPYVQQKAMFNFRGGELDPLPTLSGYNETKPDSIYLVDGKYPALVNEYTWLWVTRHGEPTRTTQQGFAKYFPNTTVEENFERYAYNCAAETEYYRALRTAGVMQFAGLSSNHEGCGTSDIFIDNLTIEPLIKEYVKDAFSPVGICIFDWSDTLALGTAHEFPIVLVNDTYQDWQGEISIEISNEDNKVVSTQLLEGKVNATGKEIFYTKIALPEVSGKYRLKATILNTKGEETSSIRKFEVL